MSSILAYLLLVCRPTTLLNTSTDPWNQHDFDTMKYAEQKCVIYYHNSPCLKLWKKYAHNQYTAICGAKK